MSPLDREDEGQNGWRDYSYICGTLHLYHGTIEIIPNTSRKITNRLQN
jgi:hypothetical protein